LRTPEEISPYSLIQEEIWRGDAGTRWRDWKILVACIMLNQTTARQVRGVLWRFLARWPSPDALRFAEPANVQSEVKSLGLSSRRAYALAAMSSDYVLNQGAGIGFDPRVLYGVGKYAHDSWRIFVERKIITGAKDKELRNYLRWARRLNKERACKKTILTISTRA